MVASFKMLFWQVFLVSGGRSSRSIEHWDNTELMVEGLSWQQVASAKLPWPMGLFRIVSFDNKIFATGENHLWMLYVVLKNMHYSVKGLLGPWMNCTEAVWFLMLLRYS